MIMDVGDKYQFIEVSYNSDDKEPVMIELYRSMRDDSNVLRRLFYWKDSHPLRDFLNHAWDRTWYLFSQRNPIKIVGALWIESHIPNESANLGIFYSSVALGESGISVDATTKLTDYMLQHGIYKRLWGITPWQLAMRHAIDAGFLLHTVLPEYVRIGERMMDTYVVLKEKPCQEL